MNETKTPKPGEWWLRNRDGRIFYVSGFNPEGWVVHWNEDVGFFSSKMRFFCQEFRHEPRCTGFGWVEPAEIDPGEGYELLPVGRRLERYDQVLASGMTGPTWVDTFYLTERIGSRPGLEGPYRRKIKAVEPPDEVFPKYYILDETKGVCKAPWYIKRTSDKEGLRWGLNCDGVTIGFESQSWGGQSDIWLEVTEAEALARVAIDPDDMPLNPVPGKVVATGTVTTTHVESSDDWVEITDSHPGHIRRLCDQVCDKYARESIHNWHYVKCTVGYSQHAYPMSRIRCRRKNLPVAVPGIKRVPVRLWINEEDGWLFASPDQ